MPMPSMMRPRMSMARFTAAALSVAPMRKLMPPHTMLARRP
uniref:GSVIVT00005628001, HT7 n=1 Tax=Arundo donax TaxID=35708 RepID=A0A0A9GYP2_ARUDO